MSYKFAPTLRWSVVGIFFMLISIPSILEKVPPNRWFGFRVAKTFSDERIWYAANRVMGYDLLIAGAVILVVALVMARLIRNYPRRANRIGLLTFIVTLTAAVAHGFWALNRM
jgi:uncharacterized membrane protein